MLKNARLGLIRNTNNLSSWRTSSLDLLNEILNNSCDSFYDLAPLDKNILYKSKVN